jgi:hypothetical protein
MAAEQEEIEHKRIFDKIAASCPVTLTMSEWLTFMSNGNRESAIWSAADCCETTMDAIKAAKPNSYVIVEAKLTGPGQMEIHSSEFHLNEPMPA